MPMRKVYVTMTRAYEWVEAKPDLVLKFTLELLATAYTSNGLLINIKGNVIYAKLQTICIFLPLAELVFGSNVSHVTPCFILRQKSIPFGAWNSNFDYLSMSNRLFGQFFPRSK